MVMGRWRGRGFISTRVLTFCPSSSMRSLRGSLGASATDNNGADSGRERGHIWRCWHDEGGAGGQTSMLGVIEGSRFGVVCLSHERCGGAGSSDPRTP